ncbi:MAG: helix-turn-helix transcriptional regulator [Lachnospiraceae bacterium]|nr:helix-turn-helix transcriptional regulator [Lachnospiraceae bacterium]
MIKAGMAITFPEFDEEDLDNKIFILEEIKLLHTKALVYSQTGDHKKAVKLLYGIKEGLIKLPEDDYEKEKKLPEILLTLSQLLIKISDFREGLKTCELGYKIALEGNRGRTIPRLLYNKALCLFHLKRNSECQSLIYQAYFGFSIFMMRKQAKQVYENAKDLFGITIETYGTHRIIDEYEPQYTPIKRGEPISFEHIGMLLAKLRVNNRMSSEELCEGICSVPTLNRIENGVRQTNVYILEALFQRLGRDINLYMNTFLSAADFEEKQIRNGIITHLVLCQYDEAKELLAKLEKSKRYQSGINLQFIKNTKAILISSQEGYSENFLKALIEGIKITRPDFDELEIGQYHLTYYEILFINNIASYYCENDKVLHGLKIYERLIESINKNCVDELEKIRTYTMILYNYSKHLGLTGRYKEAIDIIAEGEKLELRHGRIRHLDGFAINKACSYLEMGYKEESIPYFAQSYYCHAMLGEKATQENIWNYAKEKVGIAFVKV